MGPNIYKPGQGYWTRTMSAIAFGLITLMGGDWLRRQFTNTRISELKPVFIQWGVFLAVVAIGGLLIYHLIGRRVKVVDFMIATEGEMKKVNWSTRKEIVGMTWVVIGLTVFIAVLIFILDYAIYTPFFQAIKVLEIKEQ